MQTDWRARKERFRPVLLKHINNMDRINSRQGPGAFKSKIRQGKTQRNQGT